MNKRKRIKELEKELNEYKSISIGLDIGNNDGTAISIMQIMPDHLYCLYNQIFPCNSEKAIRLDELIKSKKESDFIEFKSIIKEEE